MAETFMSEDFLLQTRMARILYHEYAEQMPIYDYHCHLLAKLIAEDYKFKNLTEAWLAGDHYKWRAMRANGVDERCITGDAGDYEKFEKWAQTVPFTLRNPLYHWTHLELKRTFGITDKLLNPGTAKEIYDKCSQMLRAPDFSCRNLLRKAKVACICTTDDPADTLEHHKKLKDDKFEIKVLPCWRPDKAMAAENTAGLNKWIDALCAAADIDIVDYCDYIEALTKRHEFFHVNGCRISDHGLETSYASDFTDSRIKKIFAGIRTGKDIEGEDVLRFKSAMMYEFAQMDHEKGWVQQLHLGALRNNNTRMFKAIGPDTGFDSIGDFEIARPLARFLDKLDCIQKLPKTILYNINPKDNELVAAMIGSFQDGSCPGKIQFGPGWWFLDQKDGMQRQIESLSSLGLLSRFIGMTTDSRSFLSYPRHEYFRRILCNILGNDVENGLLPPEIELLGSMVKDICYNNAHSYFSMQTNE
jgi:glucuronate isomerase